MEQKKVKELKKEYESIKSDYNNIVVKSFNEKDFYNYTENLFTAHSCSIEGNTFTVDETFALKEKGLSLKLQNKSMFEAFEILDHFRAYEYAINNLDKPLTEEFIKKLHYILTEHTIEYRDRGKPGEYTTYDMMAGDTMFGDHEKNISKVPKLLKEVNNKIDSPENFHPLDISAIFHYHFIYLHPFRDGNGRLGRLLSNFILAKYNDPIIIIRKEQKERYIEALKISKKHNTTMPIVSFFFETSIERMKKEIAQKNRYSTIFFENFF